MQGNMELLFAIVFALQLLTGCQGDAQSCGNEVTITPSSKIVQPRGNVTIKCDGLPDAVFVWNVILTNKTSACVIFAADDEHYYHPPNTIPQNNILMILNITAEYAGRYFCERVPTTCISNKSDITIFQKASITITPEWNRRHTGEGLNLTAVVNGNPFPTTITVQKQDQTGGYVDHPSTKYSVIGLNTISFPRLSLDDNGQYRACVENSHDSIECSTFTILMTGPPMIESIPPITVKEGGNLSVVCRVIRSFGDGYEMTWQTINGSEVINDSFSQVIQLSTSELQLFVKEVSKASPVDYLCVVRNNSRILTTEYVQVYFTNIPSSPRNLKIRSTNLNGFVTITWTAPATDNGSPLTSYYVTISIEGGNSTVKQIIPDETSLDYFAGCNVINVTVTSENACGNSSGISSSIDIRSQCGAEATPAESSVSDDSNMLPIISAGIVVVVVFIGFTLFAIIIFVLWWKRQKKEIKQIPSAYNVEALSNNNVKINSLKMTVTTTPPPLIKRTTSIRRYRSMLEVPRDSVMLRDVLHGSTYFELCKGLIIISENENRTHEVMIKKAKQSAPLEEEHNIVEEIKMMSTVGVHENVVGLLRTCLSESPVYLITEYFTHGDLLGFLRASRGHYGMYTVSPGTGCKTHQCAVQPQDLLKMMTQVAAGMSYLAEKNVTHRSLCARNVLIGTGLQLKVYNYGLKADSESIPQNRNYAKWMAPEMLFDGTANTRSDVWSFGVTLWEIITIGGSPYPTTHPGQMRDLLQSGHRLHKPDHCDESLYIIMEQCWNMDPSIRPTFVEVHKHLDEMCKSKLSYLNLGLYNDEEYSQFEETHQLMTAL